MEDKVASMSILGQLSARAVLWGLDKLDLMTDGNHEARSGLRELNFPSIPLRRIVWTGGAALIFGNALISYDNIRYQQTDRDYSMEARSEVLGYDAHIKEEHIKFINLEYQGSKAYAAHRQ